MSFTVCDGNYVGARIKLANGEVPSVRMAKVKNPRFIPFCSISPKGHVCSRSRGDMKGGEDEVRTDGVEVGCMEEQTG